MNTPVDRQNAPLHSLDEWEDDVLRRYPAPGNGRDDEPAGFRNYVEAPAHVREFYRLNHRYQTHDFVKSKRDQFLPLRQREMSIWEAMEFLNTLVDESDPDTSLTQIEHLMQSAEAIRRDGHPRWFILTGLVHDIGKILCLFGEPQWAVTGDTFPTGCRYSDKIVYSGFFAENPDSKIDEYQTPAGVYEPGGGLNQVLLSWGHDEYMYQVARDYLPDEGLYMIRYHSFYAWHKEGEYAHLMNDYDRQMLPWVKAFNPYDLYSKGHERPDVEALKPYYQELIAEYFPVKVRW